RLPPGNGTDSRKCLTTGEKKVGEVVPDCGAEPCGALARGGGRSCEEGDRAVGKADGEVAAGRGEGHAAARFGLEGAAPDGARGDLPEADGAGEGGGGGAAARPGGGGPPGGPPCARPRAPP